VLVKEWIRWALLSIREIETKSKEITQS